VSQIESSGKIRCIDDIFAAMETAKLTNPHHAHLRYWFRGHSKDNWDLRPRVFRPEFVSSADESKRLKKEQHLAQEFRVNSAGLLRGGADDAELYFLQQHYRMPTRLLDWSDNPLAALFFAVTEDLEVPGTLFMMDAYALATDQGLPASRFRGIATRRNPEFRQALKPIVHWQREVCSGGFIIPVRPDHFDRRISFQRSYFTFHVPKRQVLTKEENRTLHAFTVPAGAEGKAKLQEQLSRLGMTDFSVFGDLESLARTLTKAHDDTPRDI
jgi:hypothetical protein